MNTTGDSGSRLQGTPRIHGFGDLVELIGEEVAVQIECHGRGLVTKHCLDHLDVRPTCYSQGRCSVPQGVRRETVETGRSDSWIKARSPEVAEMEHTSPRCSEHEVVGQPSRKVAGEIVGKKTQAPGGADES